MNRWLPGELEAVRCMGKVRYKTPALAGKAKECMKKKHYKDSGNRSEVKVYHCEFCRHWHLGRQRSLPKTKKKRLQKRVIL